MKVLVACEYSGIVRDAFTAKGHNAWSCDILPTESKGNHIQDDVLNHLDENWDLMIGHPVCTFICRNRARQNKIENKEIIILNFNKKNPFLDFSNKGITYPES